MYACVLIPRELSLVLALQPSPSSSPSPSHAPSPLLRPDLLTSASVWSNSHLRPGIVFYPDEGEMRLDRLDTRVSPEEDETRRSYGSYDTLLSVQGQQVRHCNWVRFVRSTPDPGSANVISSKVRGQAFFQVIRPVKPSEEIVVLFHTEALPSNAPNAAFSSVSGRTSHPHLRRESFPSEYAESLELQRYLLGHHRRPLDLKPLSSSSSPGFPHDLRQQESVSLSVQTPSSSPSLSSSSISSTMKFPILSHPLQLASPASVFPPSLAFGGLGVSPAMYDHLTHLPVERHHHLRHDSDSCHAMQKDYIDQTLSLEKPRFEKDKRLGDAPSSSSLIPFYNSPDGVFTSTPVSMVTTLKREDSDVAAETVDDKKVTNPSTDQNEEENGKTPIITGESTPMKMKAHQPRSLHFESSFSSSLSSSGLSLSTTCHDSSRPTGLNNTDEANNYNEDDNVDESLRDYSASSPMYTSGSSHSREISSASETCAGEVSGMNLSVDKESSGPCSSSELLFKVPSSATGDLHYDEACTEQNEVKEIANTRRVIIENEMSNNNHSTSPRDPCSNSELFENHMKEDVDSKPSSNDFSNSTRDEISRQSTELSTTASHPEDSHGIGGREDRAWKPPTMASQVDSTVDCTVDEIHTGDHAVGEGRNTEKEVNAARCPTSDGQISSSCGSTIGTVPTDQPQASETSAKFKDTIGRVHSFLFDEDPPIQAPPLNSAHSTEGESSLICEGMPSKNKLETSLPEEKTEEIPLKMKHNFRKFSCTESPSQEELLINGIRGQSTMFDSNNRERFPPDCDSKHFQSREYQAKDPEMFDDEPQLEPQNLSMTKAESQPSVPGVKKAESKPSIGSLPSSRDPRQPMKRCRERMWWPCDVCGKKFDRPSLLKRHTRTHTGEKPHACDVCGKAFSTSSSLNTHRRIHSGEKPHQCKICGKRFTASSNLYYHRMTHNKEKPHKCDLCSKSFPTPGDLRSHMYIHNGSWPFRCDVCNRGFSKQTNLKNHMLLHSGDKPHECPKCGKKFALLCNLKTHVKTHEHSDSSDVSSSHCLICGDPLSSSFSKPDGPNESMGITGDHGCLRCADKTRTTAAVISSSGSHTLHQTRRPSPERALLKKTHTDFSISKLTSDDNGCNTRDKFKRGQYYPHPILHHPKSRKFDHLTSSDDLLLHPKRNDLNYFPNGNESDCKNNRQKIQPLGLITSSLLAGHGERHADTSDDHGDVNTHRERRKPRSPSPPLHTGKVGEAKAVKRGTTLTPQNTTYQHFLAAAAAAAAAAAEQQQQHHHHQQQQQPQQFQQPWLLTTPALSVSSYNQLIYNPFLFSAPSLQHQISTLSARASVQYKPDVPAPYHSLDSQKSLKTSALSGGVSEHLQQQQRQLLRLVHQHEQHNQQQQQQLLQQQQLQQQQQQQQQPPHLLPVLPQPSQNLIAASGPPPAADMTSLRGGGVFAPSMPLALQLHPGTAQWTVANHTLAQGF